MDTATRDADLAAAIRATRILLDNAVKARRTGGAVTRLTATLDALVAERRTLAAR